MQDGGLKQVVNLRLGPVQKLGNPGCHERHPPAVADVVRPPHQIKREQPSSRERDSHTDDRRRFEFVGVAPSRRMTLNA